MKRECECHPGRPHYAKGLCSPCYQRAYGRKWRESKTRAKCHPERAHKARGLCSACYQAFKLTPAFKPSARGRTPITCGHPDRRHAGRGMCEGCWTRSYRDRDRDGDRVKRKDYQLRATYGITLEQFNALFEAQGSACALCKKGVEAERDRHVDHCHETGNIRGVLCFTCNKALGALGDTPESIRAALEYVERGKRQSCVERIAAHAGVYVQREAA